MTHERSSNFTIKGRHVLIAFIVFFGIIIVTDFYFVRLAVTSFPGEEVEKSYYQGLQYNDVLDEKARQAEHGWRMQLVAVPEASTNGVIDVKILDKAGKPVFDAVITGHIVRPMTDRGLQELSFFPLSDGIFRARPQSLDSGVWNLSLSAGTGEGAEPILSADTRVLIP